MRKIPLCDLYPVLQNCKIAVAVGEANSSKCSGVLSVVIFTNLGVSETLVRNVTDLEITMQEVVFDETPQTGMIHPIVSYLVLDSGEFRKDDEMIKLCSK